MHRWRAVAPRSAARCVGPCRYLPTLRTMNAVAVCLAICRPSCLTPLRDRLFRFDVQSHQAVKDSTIQGCISNFPASLPPPSHLQKLLFHRMPHACQHIGLLAGQLIASHRLPSRGLSGNPQTSVRASLTHNAYLKHYTKKQKAKADVELPYSYRRLDTIPTLVNHGESLHLCLG